MIEKRADRPRAITLAPTRAEPGLGLDPGDTSDFVNELRTMNVRPHGRGACAARPSIAAPPAIPTMARASASANA